MLPAARVLALLLICAIFDSAANSFLECGMVSIWNADGFTDCEAASAAWNQRARSRRQSFREEMRPEVITLTIFLAVVPLSRPLNRRSFAPTRPGMALVIRGATATGMLSQQERSLLLVTAFGAGKATTAAHLS